MRVPMYQVDAFTSQLFSGNPAAVCILERWPDDSIMAAIASENNLSETAFLVKCDDSFELRWFSPVTEVSLCGHATLASGFVMLEVKQYKKDTVSFRTKSGVLSVMRSRDLLKMDFPCQPPSKLGMPKDLEKALNALPLEVFGTQKVIMAVMEDEDTVRNMEPDFTVLAQMRQRGTIVTAQGKQSDFVSSYFAPHLGVRRTRLQVRLTAY